MNFLLATEEGVRKYFAAISADFADLSSPDHDV